VNNLDVSNKSGTVTGLVGLAFSAQLSTVLTIIW
jgi:hypothetical protein